MNLINITFFIKTSLKSQLFDFIRHSLANDIHSVCITAEFSLFQVLSPLPAEADELTYSLQLRLREGEEKIVSLENLLDDTLNKFRISTEQNMLFFISKMKEIKL